MDEPKTTLDPPQFLTQDPLWEAAYRAYLRFWINLARTAQVDEDEAKDVVHGVIFSAMTGGTVSFQSKEHIRNYISRAVLNRAIELRKVGSKKSGWSEALEFQCPVVEEHEEHDDNVQRKALREALRRLSRNEYQIVKLRFYAGLTFPEISQMLQVPVSTLKSREEVAIKKIRKWLRKNGV